ncbi:hypothetical protein SLEP1_g22886 [Rubroshorea leprosula]|uniref:Uncharacterized protein n=1 Tax=Rubroshorea leprosula TaxID=152421 RepID=A0AAV5JFX7_9ROSI|nr:hypothetical protein SLEP1_g22886 [Rubroshorea leprosula]
MPLPPIEGESSSQEARVAHQGKGKGDVHLPTSSFYEAGMRSMTKRFINTYFPKVDRQQAQDKVALDGGAANLINALSNKFFESLKERTRKICEDKLDKKEMELDEVRKVAANLELQVHNSAEKVKLQYLEVDVTKVTFEDQEGEVKENGESGTADF